MFQQFLALCHRCIIYTSFESYYSAWHFVYAASCSMSGELGVGEFGVVRRGVWSVRGEEREVAVKSLADGSTEEKRIQEAAIMSQFKHPSVITLHGVIMDQDLVDQC